MDRLHLMQIRARLHSACRLRSGQSARSRSADWWVIAIITEPENYRHIDGDKLAFVRTCAPCAALIAPTYVNWISAPMTPFINLRCKVQPTTEQFVCVLSYPKSFINKLTQAWVIFSPDLQSRSLLEVSYRKSPFIALIISHYGYIEPIIYFWISIDGI